jgi:hypothetical protein
LREIIGGYSEGDGYFYYSYDHYLIGYLTYYSGNTHYGYYDYGYFYHYDFVSWGTLKPCNERTVCGGFCILGGGSIGSTGVCKPGAFLCSCSGSM